MDGRIQDSSMAALDALTREESALEAKAREMETALSGLKDLDVLFRLAEVKLEACLHMVKRASGDDGLGARISEKALSALSIIDGLLTENISEDQKDAVREDPRFSAVKEKLQQFIMAGGGGFLEARETHRAREHTLSRTIVSCIRKYAAPDDGYEPLDPSDYPDFVRRILLALFPASVRENPQGPPYGIEEGEETVYESPNMKIPVSQAALYIEEEVLPELRRQLEGSPGDGRLQKEIQKMERTAAEYKKMKFFPRSTPVLLEQNFYTDGLASYSADGELLVPIPVPVSFKSGTNTDRRMELVRMELVKRLAGRGISEELDAEYKRMKSLESGPRGSSQSTAMKIDPGWGFLALKRGCPALARLEDKKKFGELERIALEGNPGKSALRIESLLRSDDREEPDRKRLT